MDKIIATSSLLDSILASSNKLPIVEDNNVDKKENKPKVPPGRVKNADKLQDGKLVKILSHRNRLDGMTCLCRWACKQTGQIREYHDKLDKLVSAYPDKVAEYLANLKANQPRAHSGFLRNAPGVYDKL